jgi:CDP-diacylglycerol pyrophosphatase
VVLDQTNRAVLVVVVVVVVVAAAVVMVEFVNEEKKFQEKILSKAITFFCVFTFTLFEV